jgi:hypothetical protein
MQDRAHNSSPGVRMARAGHLKTDRRNPLVHVD